MTWVSRKEDHPRTSRQRTVGLELAQTRGCGPGTRLQEREGSWCRGSLSTSPAQRTSCRPSLAANGTGSHSSFPGRQTAVRTPSFAASRLRKSLLPLNRGRWMPSESGRELPAELSRTRHWQISRGHLVFNYPRQRLAAWQHQTAAIAPSNPIDDDGPDLGHWATPAPPKWRCNVQRAENRYIWAAGPGDDLRAALSPWCARNPTGRLAGWLAGWQAGSPAGAGAALPRLSSSSSADRRSPTEDWGREDEGRRRRRRRRRRTFRVSLVTALPCRTGPGGAICCPRSHCWQRSVSQRDFWQRHVGTHDLAPAGLSWAPPALSHQGFVGHWARRHQLTLLRAAPSQRRDAEGEGAEGPEGPARRGCCCPAGRINDVGPGAVPSRVAS